MQLVQTHSFSSRFIDRLRVDTIVPLRIVELVPQSSVYLGYRIWLALDIHKDLRVDSGDHEERAFIRMIRAVYLNRFQAVPSESDPP